MKRSSLVILITFVLALAFCLGGCKKSQREKINTFGNTTKGIFVYNDGCIQDVIFDDFDMTRYDADEFKTYLQAEIGEYNKTHDFVAPEAETNKEGETVAPPRVSEPISIAVCEAKDDELNCQLLYATTEDYLNYQAEEIGKRGGNTLQTGGLLYADASVIGASFVDTDGEPVDMQKLLTNKHAGEYRYIICNFDSVIYCEGDIYAYTTTGTYNSEADCISVPAGTTVVILYVQK